MSTDLLKNLVMDKISEIDDKDFLKALKTIIEQKKLPSRKYKTSAVQKAKISKGLRDLKKGFKVSNADLDNDEDRWLKK